MQHVAKSGTSLRALALSACALSAISGAAPARAETFQLSYEGRAYGLLPLGRASLEFSFDADQYTVTGTIASGGLIELFERTRLTAHAFGRMEAGHPVWENYSLNHAYSRKHRRVFMRHTGAAVETQITPTYRVWGDPPASAAQQRASRDPLSSMMAMAAHVGRTRACEGVYPTFDGRFHYHLVLSGGRQDTLRADGFDGPVLRCTLRFVPVAGYEPDRDGGESRIPVGDMWFALLDDTNFAPPLRVAAPLPLGQVTISLASWRRPIVQVGRPVLESTP